MKQALITFMQQQEGCDEYVTPLGAVQVLHHNLSWLGSKRVIWEPCDPTGTSNITKELKRIGHKVISTGLPTIDFLHQHKPPKGVGGIITNPPYSLKDTFLEHCFSLGLPFCMLLPLTTLEGVCRGTLFRKYGIQVLVLDRRVQFITGKSVYFNTSWFCWSPTKPLLEHDLVFVRLSEGT